MKKLLVLLLACLSFAYSSAQDQEGVFSLSANVNYGTEIESLGLGLRGQYGFTRNIRGVAEYKYYIDRHNLSEWEINGDIHYVFGSSEDLLFYPIAGFKFSRWTLDTSRGKSDNSFTNYTYTKYSNNRFGLNLGFGTQIAVGEKTYLQPEIKYELIKDYSQFVFSLGFMYQF